MITNIRLDLDDDQRRQIASLIAGKPVKRLATRGEIVGFVQEALTVELAARRYESRPSDPRDNGSLPETAMETDARETVREFCSDDCCRANDLLRTRVNVLQHKLDTMR